MIKLLISIFTGLFFIAIGLYAWNTQAPIGFFTGLDVERNEISNIKGYNREVGKMWMIYGTVFIGVSVLSIPFGAWAYFIVTLFVLFFGMIVMIMHYDTIYDKYKVK
ncbi:MAG: hypothetical protein RSA96_02985 [Erysipelotrichaceae bacterium]